VTDRLALPAAEAEIIDPVLEWYRDSARDLPWREPDATAWGILVSEVMLQQTPVVRVLPRWREWMERWPAPVVVRRSPVHAIASPA
jgi:A/G-specific adenine glycosylase